MTRKQTVFAIALVLAAITFNPIHAARPCVTAEPSPTCEPAKPSPCVAANPSPRCPSPKQSPCVRAEPSPRCPSPKQSPCVRAEPSPIQSPCVRAEPSPKQSPCVRAEPSPKQSPCVRAEPSPKQSPCVRAEPSPSCPSPQQSPCVRAEASSRCQPRAVPKPACKPNCKAVLSVLQSRPPCTTSLFLDLVKAAGMEQSFESANLRGATIFVPTNKAIESTLEFLGMDLDYIMTKEVAAELVNHHIAENKELYAYQVLHNGVFLYTRNYWADALYLYRDGSKGDIAVVSAQTDAHLILDDADNQNVNIKTCSGVMHFVDALLVPTSIVEQFKQPKH